MKTILIATHNKAKLEELTLGIINFIKEVKILNLNDLKIVEDPQETGKTFEENAKMKVVYYGNKTGYPTIADDGGLHIEALNGEPGVKSKRWLGREASDQELILYALEKLNGIPKEKRTAFLKTTLCFYDPSTKSLLYETEKIKGYIALKASGNPTKGYPFRALFIVEKFSKYYDELTDKEHLEINHRLKALKRLVRKIKPILLYPFAFKLQGYNT